MKVMETVFAHPSTIEVSASLTKGEDVTIWMIEPEQTMRGYASARLTPAEAVALSCALVKAAAEALGTSVDMTRTKEDMLLSIRATAASLPKGPL